jgi:hypothetical protein
VKPQQSYKGKAMDKECNEIGKDIVGRSKTTKASPRCLLNFMKKMNQRSRKMNQSYKKLKIHFSR